MPFDVSGGEFFFATIGEFYIGSDTLLERGIHGVWMATSDDQ
jgi:hypothetical protein